MNDTLIIYLKRALHKKCPQCGIGNMFLRWNVLSDTCSSCGCNFELRAENSWFFTYMSTAFLTGIIVLWMLFFPSKNYFLGYLFTFIGWLLLIVLTLPYRKAMAIGIDYWLETKMG